MGKISSTYQQRLFSDEQLGSSIHDEIVRWIDLRTKSGAGTLLRALEVPHIEDLEGKCRAWGKRIIDLDDFRSYEDRILVDLIWMCLNEHLPKYPAPPEIEISHPVWEKIIAGPRGGVVGAIDLAFSIKVHRPVLHIQITNDLPMDESKLRERLNGIFGERASGVWTNRKFAIAGDQGWRSCVHELPRVLAIIRHGYRTICIERISWEIAEWAHDIHYVYAEAKTDIRSAGELLRQMNVYRGYVSTRGNKFLVVAPREKVPCGVETILKEQGINFLAYRSN